jgi:hypothetical protein
MDRQVVADEDKAAGLARVIEKVGELVVNVSTALEKNKSGWLKLIALAMVGTSLAMLVHVGVRTDPKQFIPQSDSGCRESSGGIICG